MFNSFLIVIGKLAAFVSRLLNKGNGSTWPGHIALFFNKHFIQEIQKNSGIKIALIVGTNGKTTTAKMITTILEQNGKKVLQNTSGANLLNGIASTLLLHADFIGKVQADFAIFEVDENVLPLILSDVKPFAVIALNLFRDQLDRYGELDSIARKWKESFALLPKESFLILNADDPQIAYLGIGRGAGVRDVLYFGLEEKGTKNLQHAADSIYCPKCNAKLLFDRIYYSHLGIWHCMHCHLKRPQPTVTSFFYPLSGTYNEYNTLAAVLFARQVGISDEEIKKGLQIITPAFGRQEKIQRDGKTVQIFLAKNPTSFNQSLETIRDCHSERLQGVEKSHSTDENNNSNAEIFSTSDAKRSLSRKGTSFSEASHFGRDDRKSIFRTSNKSILFVLNDRIPDGRDVSWIWDIDIEDYIHAFKNILVSGDRVYDMGLRLEYANGTQKSKIKSFENVEEAIKVGLDNLQIGETLYILPTYSAMLEVRKILTGRKIL